MSEAVFLHDWENIEGLMGDFEITEGDLEGVEILLASYTYENYSGDAFVLFRKGGKLYEVNGGHCSCSGLEGQWDPEETTVAELRHRLTEGNLGRYYGNEFADELSAVLDRIEKEAGGGE